MAAKAELKGRLTLTDNAFHAGLRKAVRGATSAGRAIGRGFKSLVTGPVAALGAALAGAVTIRAFAGGIKGALDLGGAMVDLKAQTGATADELLVLRQVLADNGVEADKAGSILNKLQKTLVDAAQGGKQGALALGQIGLSAEELMKLSPVRQFQRIAESIAKLPDPAARASAAMKIFGKSGGELLAVFQNASGFEDASRSLGRQAKILAENAEDFDTISDRLGRAGLKFQGFFIGVASTLTPALLKWSAALDESDLAAQGERFGAAIKSAAEYFTGAFANPDVMLKSFGDRLQYHIRAAMNGLAAIFVNEVPKLLEKVIPGFKAMRSMLGLKGGPALDMFGAEGFKRSADRADKFLKDTGAEAFAGAGSGAAKPAPARLGPAGFDRFKNFRTYAPPMLQGATMAGGLQSDIWSGSKRSIGSYSSLTTGGLSSGASASSGAFNLIRRGDKARAKAEMQKAEKGVDKSNALLKQLVDINREAWE